MKRNTIALALGMSSSFMTAPSLVMAQVHNYNWNGMFTMLDPNGQAIANASIPYKGYNQFQSPVSGTMSFDSVSGVGTATLAPFGFLAGIQPFESSDINLQAIGDGMGGTGTLVLVNMLLNWNGNTGIPSSSVFDAAGFFAGELTAGGTSSAVPASDGTYVGSWVQDTVLGPYGYPGYLGLGPVPIATTAWNTTNATSCVSAADSDFTNNTSGGCIGVSPSGDLPLVFDTAANLYDDTANLGGGIGGSPMQDGPFNGLNVNLNIISLTQVPVPAAIWLFGSGILTMLGLVRLNKPSPVN